MIWGILGLGFILRLISLNQSLWLDEGINVIAAQKFTFLGMITQYAVADFHPPGWFMILWIWGKIFGYSEIAIRLPSVIFGIITIYIVYLIGKKLVSKDLGLIAAIILSINPLHIYYSQEARMYALATLAVSVNILLLLKLIKEEKVNTVFLSLSNALVFASDYLAYFIFPAEGVFLLLVHKKALVKKWLAALGLAVLLYIWWLPIFFRQLDTGSAASANLSTWKFVNGAFDFKTLPLTFVKFIIGRISLSNKILYAAVLLPVGGLFSFLLLRGIKHASTLSKRILISWLFIPLSIATAISVVIPVYNYFRVLFVIPSFIYLISLGIWSFNKRLKYVCLGIVISIEVFCSLVYLLNPIYQREDWKGLVSYLKTVNQKPVVLFESSGTLPPFDYYAKNEINAIGALKDFPAKNMEDIIDLKVALKGSTNIFLVNYLIDISDPNRLVAQKLDESGYSLLDTKDFRGVGFLYHYVRK